MEKIELIINRKEYSDHAVERATIEELKDGEVLMEVERFSFTSNNITYAIIGDMIGYWKFFKAEEGKGKLPGWGFAKVISSKSDALSEGERFYGYYPMGSHLIVEPAKVNEFGFLDGAEHRRPLPPIYNYYTNTKKDAVYAQETEDIQCLLRPLFTTSFLIDDQFADNDFYGSEQIILTSASSKTGLALAHLLKKRKTAGAASFDIVGLTSPSNKDFVIASGYYDSVITYDEYANITKEKASSIVDFSGNHKLQYDLQVHLGESLKYNCLVGVVHWEDLRGQEKLPQKGTFFFAPTNAQKRQQDWGREGFQQRLKDAWNGFIPETKDWMSIETYEGAEKLSDIYSKMLSGDFDPKIGYIIKPTV